MHNGPIKTLLFEDDPGDFALLREYIAEDKSANIKLENVQRLEDGLELLSQNKFVSTGRPHCGSKCYWLAC